MDASFGNSFSMRLIAPMTVAEIRARWGDAYLVVQGAQPPSPFDEDTTGHGIDVIMPADPAPIRGLCYAVLKKPTSAFDWISVGRHENNDLYVPHASISRFHALLRPVAAGGFVLQDAKSANGTWIGETRVPASGVGDAQKVDVGTVLRFGDVIMLYLDAPGLQNLALRTRSHGSMPGVGGG